MIFRKAAIVCLVALLSGCAATGGADKKALTETPIMSKGDSFKVWKHDGRIYVTGTEKTAKAFAKHKHLPYTKTLLGAGPMGETVVFEVAKKDPSLAARLIETYKATPYLLDSDDNYWVYKYQGRIYVIGQDKTNASFKAHKHLPYTKTLLGAGPNGETVIFEVAKKDPSVAAGLIEKFKSSPFPIDSAENYWVYKYQGRIYVIGKEKTNASFKAHKHLPYTKTLIGQGPMGETVIFEVDKKDPSLTERLMSTF